MKKKKKEPEEVKREPMIQQQVTPTISQPETLIQQPEQQPQHVTQPQSQVSEPPVNPPQQNIVPSYPEATTQQTVQPETLETIQDNSPP